MIIDSLEIVFRHMSQWSTWGFICLSIVLLNLSLLDQRKNDNNAEKLVEGVVSGDEEQWLTIVKCYNPPHHYADAYEMYCKVSWDADIIRQVIT